VAAAGLGAAARQSVEDAAGEAGWVTAFKENLGEQRLPPVVETAAFRILQEALANVRKHARSRRIDVELRRQEDWLHLEVRDYGIGLNGEGSEGRGLGLVSMRERARLVGGTCAIETPADQGLRVHVRLPLRAGG